MANGRPAKGPERFLTYGVGNRLSGWCATAGKRYLKSTWGYYIRAGQVVCVGSGPAEIDACANRQSRNRGLLLKGEPYDACSYFVLLAATSCYLQLLRVVLRLKVNSLIAARS